jgi:hypothetical protein
LKRLNRPLRTLDLFLTSTGRSERGIAFFPIRLSLCFSIGQILLGVDSVSYRK